MLKIELSDLAMRIIPPWTMNCGRNAL